ncbi:MAG: EAL domain-containing protein, partial [Sandarakinorhabdus sp.]|nr:EAL domain-containing protein [Sandarakinorhabdus sp.]
MSFMFRPPVAASTPIGWRQLLGFGQGDERFFARVRAEQLQALNRFVPFNITLLVVNIAALLFSLRGAASPTFLARWGLVMVGLTLLWTVRFILIRRRGEALEASRTLFWSVCAEVGAFGLCWSALVFHLMPRAPLEMQAVLMLLSLTVMGACGLAAAAMPVCGIGMVVVVGASTLASLPAGSPLGGPMIELAFLTFGLLSGRGVIITSHALMARLRGEADSEVQNEMVRLLLSEFESNGSDWLLEVDSEGRLTHVSPRLAEIARVPAHTLIGQSLMGLLGGEKRGSGRSAVKALTSTFQARRGFRDITIPVNIGGETRWWALSGTPKIDMQGNFTGYRGVGRDVTEARRSHERIVELARFDPLTGLANRALFRESLGDALARATRTGWSCGLLFIDLDHFKAVNDRLGHAAGDQLLREAAVRMRGAIGGNATLARLGGDEFAVLLADAVPARVASVAEAVVASLAKPFSIEGQPVTIGASVGTAIGPGDGAALDKLLKSADLALYEAKRAGRGSVVAYVPALRENADARRDIETALAQALDHGELSLAFQPVVEAADEHIVGFEALLRWTHPELGRIAPDRFIPIAESTGLIVPIGHWVIQTACEWAARWPAHIRIAVNLSPAQIGDPRLVEVIETALRDNRIDPARLELEITESLFLDESATTIETLATLKGLGVAFALDDFGTGYSSLGYLHKAAFSRIKIDRSFVSRALQPNGEASAIIQAIVTLAHSLDMVTTAEGTETRAEFELCRSLGCEQVQGYLFGRP